MAPGRLLHQLVFGRGGFFFAVGDRALGDNLVEQAKFLGFFGAEEAVALHGLFDVRQIFAGVLDVDVVQTGTQRKNFAGLNFNVRSLALDRKSVV